MVVNTFPNDNFSIYQMWWYYQIDTKIIYFEFNHDSRLIISFDPNHWTDLKFGTIRRKKEFELFETESELKIWTKKFLINQTIYIENDSEQFLIELFFYKKDVLKINGS